MAYGGILNTGASAGWTKDEVMTSETASLYGLGSDAVPDNGGGIRWWYQGVGGSDTSYAAGQLNTSGKTYYYVAIG